ncbi:MAG TPA: TMEM43 family protein [Lysobacter sp.]|nr:TMEM43 family protein [Lysobacter sp.]
MRRPLAALLLLAFAAPAAPQPAETGGAEVPLGEPVPGEVLSDREFGVVSRRFGLQRQVEMYQWRRAGAGYVAEWSAGVIDSRGFDPAHRNPGEMPLSSRIWWAKDATLDGKPLPEAVLRALGEWRTFRPNFTRLPANLAATFQPDGDGLSSAENPLKPEIGDLRIGWRELHLPPLEGRVVLRDGVWELTPQAQAALSVQSNAFAPVARPAEPGRVRGLGPWLGAAALAAIALLWALRARRRRRRGD